MLARHDREPVNPDIRKSFIRLRFRRFREIDGPVDTREARAYPTSEPIHRLLTPSAPIQRLAETVSSWFLPAVIAAAAITFLVWSASGPEPRLAHALVNAVAVLIIACPCALGLATPMSIMVGTGRGAEAGVLIRNAEALELLEKVTTLVVDKTGTLTERKPKLVTIEPQPGIDAAGLLRLTASVDTSASIRWPQRLSEARVNGMSPLPTSRALKR